MIAALGDGSLRRWDVSTGKERPDRPAEAREGARILDRGLDGVDRAVFSRDGRSVALIGEDWVAGFGRRQRRAAFQGIGALGMDAVRLPPTAGAWRSSDEARQADQAGRRAERFLDRPSEHDPLARQPDGPRAPRDRDPRVHRDFPGVFSGWARRSLPAPLLHPERGIIRIFRLQDKQEIQTFEAPCYSIQSLCFTPDGKQIVAGLSDTSIVIWDVRARDE